MSGPRTLSTYVPASVSASLLAHLVLPDVFANVFAGICTSIIAGVLGTYLCQHLYRKSLRVSSNFILHIALVRFEKSSFHFHSGIVPGAFGTYLCQHQYWDLCRRVRHLPLPTSVPASVPASVPGSMPVCSALPFAGASRVSRGPRVFFLSSHAHVWAPLPIC